MQDREEEFEEGTDQELEASFVEVFGVEAEEEDLPPVAPEPSLEVEEEGEESRIKNQRGRALYVPLEDRTIRLAPRASTIVESQDVTWQTLQLARAGDIFVSSLNAGDS